MLLVRAQGLALFHFAAASSFADAHRHAPACLSSLSNPSFQGPHPYCAYNKKTPQREFLCYWYARRDWLCFTSPLRPRSQTLTGMLPPASRPCRTLRSRDLTLTARITKKLPKGSFFVIGTRAGIRTLDPLIKSQLL